MRVSIQTIIIIITLFSPFLLVNCQSDTGPKILTGKPSIVDVDTIYIDGYKIRVWGIDGPGEHDFGQPDAVKAYDAEATEFLENHAAKSVDCHLTGKKSYDRYLARCYFTDSKRDLASYIVSFGYAVDDPRFSNGYYYDIMRKAQDANIGVWRTIDESWR